MLLSGCPGRSGAPRTGYCDDRCQAGSGGIDLKSLELYLRVLPRKEVIQPHLPVRLPCYDFTPLTLHTFGASVPWGFGRRLRVQTTRVV